MEYLHQYRGTAEERLLEEQRRMSRGGSRGQSLDGFSSGGGGGMLMMSPDARAATYTYEEAVLPFATDETPGESIEQHDNLRADATCPPFAAAPLPPDTTSTDFEMNRAAIEALSTTNTTKVFKDVERHQEDAHLICEGERNEEMHNTSTSTSTIPFEAFLRLAESQIMAGDRPQQQQNEEPLSATTPHLPTNSNMTDSSGDDSIIPMASFMALGASMMAEAISASKSEEKGNEGIADEKVDEDDTTAPLTEAGQSQMDDSSSLAASMCQPQNIGTSSSQTIPATSTSPILETVEVDDHDITTTDIKETKDDSKVAALIENPTDVALTEDTETQHREDVQTLPVTAPEETAENTVTDASATESSKDDGNAPTAPASVEEEMVENEERDAKVIDEIPSENEASKESSPGTNEGTLSSSGDAHISENDILDESWENVQGNNGTGEETSVVSQETSFSEPVVVDNKILFSDDTQKTKDAVQEETKEDSEVNKDDSIEELKPVSAASATLKDDIEHHESSSTVVSPAVPAEVACDDAPTNLPFETSTPASDTNTTETPDLQDEHGAELNASEREANSESPLAQNQVDLLSSPTPNDEAQAPRRRRRRKKKKDGYYPASSHFVLRHYFSR